MIRGENPPSDSGNTAWNPYEASTLPTRQYNPNATVDGTTSQYPVNGADRNDNGMIRGENPPSDSGNTAWNPYEALTLPTRQYNPNATTDGTRSPASDQGNTAWDPYEALTLPMQQYNPNATMDGTTSRYPVNSADRNDNAMTKGENPSSDNGNTAWNPYEALTLPTRQYNPNATMDGTTSQYPVNSADRNDNGMIRGENPPSDSGNTAWDPYESMTVPSEQDRYDPNATLPPTRFPEEQVRDAKKITRLMSKQ
jgi:hypothetical protein